MKRWLLITSGVIVLFLVVGKIAVWWWLGQPIYSPGATATRTDLNPPQQPENTDQWQVTDEIALFHYSVGTGRNVLMVHGGPGLPTREAYPGLTELNEQFRFHYFDQRGCGQSSRPIWSDWSPNTYENIQHLEGTLGIGAQIADIERIRRILGDERIIIIGHSYGAFLASLYASEFPGNVDALVLISPADLLVLPSASGGLFDIMRERLPNETHEKFDNWIDRYLDLGNVFDKSEDDLLSEDLEFSRFYRAASGQLLEEMSMTQDIGTWMIRAQYFSMGRRHNYRKALKKVKVPVLVVHGADDMQPESVALSYSDAFPNAQCRTIEGAGHFPQIKKPDEFLATVSEFLGSVK